MPLPAIPAISAVVAAVLPWVTRWFLAKSAIMFAGFLGRLGIVIATNELVLEPLINHITSAWSGLPGQFKCWLDLFGVTQVASLYVSAITLLGVKKLFFARSS
jgi:hypothetical protein